MTGETVERPAGNGYLPTLDGWRAVAILAVVVCHASDALFCVGGPYASPLLYTVTRSGAIGVQIFFGISGFLICSRLLAEFERYGEIRLVDFYVRRMFRILPAYLAYLAAVAALASAGVVAVSRGELVSCLTFLRNYLPSPQGDGWYTGHFWSLAVEEHFYLLWPTFLALAGPRIARPWVIAAAVAIGVWRAVDFRLGLIAQWVPGIGFYGRTDTRLDGLLWGCALALALAVKAHERWWGRRLASWIGWAGAAAFVCCVAIRLPLEMTWEALLVPLLLAGTILNPGRSVGRALESRPLRFIGRISYSLYLWQQLFLVASDLPRPLPFGFLQEWPMNVPAAIFCALLSYYLIERPMIRLGRRVTAVLGSQMRQQQVPS